MQGGRANPAYKKASAALANLTAKYSTMHKGDSVCVTKKDNSRESRTLDNPVPDYSLDVNAGMKPRRSSKLRLTAEPRESKHAEVGLRHKRTKSEYLFAPRNQPSPVPVPAKTYTRHPTRERPATSNKSSFKLIFTPPEPTTNLPGIPVGRKQTPREEGNTTSVIIPCANGTAITSNTNIVLVGGHSYKISTLGDEEVIRISTSGTGYRKESASVATEYQTASKKCLKVVAGTRAGAEVNAKSHKRSISDSHASGTGATSLRLSNNVERLFQEAEIRASRVGHNQANRTAHHVVIPNAASGKSLVTMAAGGTMQDPGEERHLHKKSRSIVCGKLPAMIRRLSKKEGRKTVAGAGRSNIASIINSIKAKRMGTEDHTKENSVESGSVAREYISEKGRRIGDTIPCPEEEEEEMMMTISEEHKMDPRREKEMLELSDYIKQYWRENRGAPKTTVNFYKIGKMLGKGAFGKVNLGIHKLTGKFVAIKSISKELMKDATSQSKVMREVAIWEQLTHPSVIRYFLGAIVSVDCTRPSSLRSICCMSRSSASAGIS